MNDPFNMKQVPHSRSEGRPSRGRRTSRSGYGLLDQIQTPRCRFVILATFLAFCLFTGGSSRADAELLLIFRPVTVLTLAALLIASPNLRLGNLRTPAILLGMFALTMAIQLVPLPAAFWLSLPGHGHFTEAAGAIGVAQPWRPLSLTPDLTFNSLVALLPAVVMVVGYAGIASYRRYLLLFPLLLAGTSIVVGLIQITGGADSPAYLYRPTSDMLPVGLFANRNHQAAVLASALPVLSVWACYPKLNRHRIAVAVAGLLLVLPVILVTGSRMGMLLAGAGSVAAILLVLPGLRGRRIPPVVLAVGGLLVLSVVGATVLAGRAISIDRLAELDGSRVDLRWVTLPIVSQMTWDFLPAGAGYGAFDQVFRGYEPDSLLKPTFFNRAHNDVLETIFSGGMPAVLVMLLFIGWWIRQTVRATRRYRQGSQSALMARLGAVVSGMLLLASLVDYPLRTPLAGVLFVLACCWLVGASDTDDERSGNDNGLARSIAFRRRAS